MELANIFRLFPRIGSGTQKQDLQVIETAASPLLMLINDCLCFFAFLQKPYPNDLKAINFTWSALKNIFLFETPLICCIFVYFCSFTVDQTVKLC